VTKKEIVKQIADELRIPQADAKLVVHQLFKTIIDTLVKEGRIELRNFGVFVVKQRQPRNARNPRTNEPVQVEAKKVVTFQPGKTMEERVRVADVVVEPKRKTTKTSNPSANGKAKAKAKGKTTPKKTAKSAPKPRQSRKPKPVPVGASQPALHSVGIPEPDTLPFPTMEHASTADPMEPREYMPVDDLPNKPR